MSLFRKDTSEELSQKLWRAFAKPNHGWGVNKKISLQKVQNLLDAGADPDYQKDGISIMDNILAGMPKFLMPSSYPAISLVLSKMTKIDEVSGDPPLIHLTKMHETICYARYYKTYFSDTAQYIDRNVYKDLIDKIIQKNTDLNAQDSNNHDTALMLSIKEEATSTAYQILEKKPDLNLQNDQGNTALMLAIIEGEESIAKKILEQNPNLNLKNKEGNTALMLCLLHKRFDLARLIAENTSNVNATNKNKETALLLALKHQQQDLAEKLLDKGANPQAASDEGDAFYFARTESMHKLLKGKISELGTAEIQKDPNIVILTTKMTSTMTLIEAFNFERMECASFLQTEGQAAGAPSRETFESLQDSPALQEAFNQHKKMGGKTDPDTLFSKKKVALPGNTTSP